MDLFKLSHPFFQLLIPIASVLKISKEKTARIIPNAVGVATLDEKHVFGSFMSRDSAHRLMLQVWRAARPASNGDDNSLDAVRVRQFQVYNSCNF